MISSWNVPPRAVLLIRYPHGWLRNIFIHYYLFSLRLSTIPLPWVIFLLSFVKPLFSLLSKRFRLTRTSWVTTALFPICLLLESSLRKLSPLRCQNTLIEIALVTRISLRTYVAEVLKLPLLVCKMTSWGQLMTKMLFFYSCWTYLRHLIPWIMVSC